MPVAISPYLAAIECLTPKMTLYVEDVPWAEYEELLDDLGDSSGARIFYNQGRMEVMPPTYSHEKPKDIVHRLVIAIDDELGINIEFAGSTTLKKELTAKGAEPDTCFYVQNAALVMGRTDLRLDDTPPPDVVVEIDRSNFSLDKFEIYAGLGVPELWRWHQNRLRFYRLAGEKYEEITHSRAFPFLPADALTNFVSIGWRESERAAAKAFRVWLRENAA